MASYEIIQDNFWFGVGNGDIKDELEKKYEEYQIADQLKKNYNPHNQFLATFVSVGFVGFILLVLVFLLPVIKAFREKNYLLLSFMAIVFVHALTESIFARLQGIIFFSFFYGLIMTLTTFGPRNKLSDRQPGNQNLTEKSSGS
jgi:O-antigen ligase